MCGILGIWHRDGRAVDLAALARATGVLRHRGPDDEGYLLVDTSTGRTELCGGPQTAPELALPRLDEFRGQHFDLALGFRRLAILDLSPAGHQPMASADGECWLVFNGEVYNYIELRSELVARGYRFKSGTDTEVILAAYQEWGPECLQHFNGMWSLAIWDGPQRRLFVARDRFGVKPFYMTGDEARTWAFASEIKALLALGAVPFRPNAAAISRFVAQGGYLSHVAGETFFEGVSALPAAHFALVRQDRERQGRYWSLPAPRDAARKAGKDALDEYRELFIDSVRLRLRADVPVGTCLSGGVDSSSIVAVAGQLMQTEHAVSLELLGEHQQTFSAVYETPGAWNEKEYIDRVVAHTGAAGNYTYPTPDGLWDDLERLVWHQDEPFQSTSIFAQWCVMRLARERGVTVLLDGQGADEVLGGYRPFSVLLAQMVRSGRLLHAISALRDIRHVTGADPRPILTRALAVQAPSSLLRAVRGTRVSTALDGSGLRGDLQADYSRARARQLSEVDIAGTERNLSAHLARLLVEDSLPNLLRYEDRNSMAFSIEARVPFLDYRLVEYAFTSAAPLRIYRGWTKWVQRMAVRKVLPPQIVWRRDKVGFETPERQWMREGRDRILDILDESRPAAEYLDMQQVHAHVPSLLEEPGGIPLVWRWVNLAMWLKAFAGQGATP